MPFAGVFNETGKGGNYDTGPAKWKANISVATGDLIYMDSGDSNYTKPAACVTYAGPIASSANTALNQSNFKANFAGISMAKRLSTETTDGNDLTHGGVFTSGEFVLSIDSTTANQAPGTYVAVANSANTILSQNVTITSNVSIAIGKVSQWYTTGLGYITVDIFPQKFTGAGVQAIA